MKILVISDNHGETENMKKILATEKYDKSIHCGDYLIPDKDILAMFDYVVSGNNDYSSKIQDDMFIKAGGKKIFLTHGDSYAPTFKTGEGVSHRKVLNKYQREIDIIVHGHTHIPRKQMTPDTLIVCPGSIDFPRDGSEKSYCIIDIKRNTKEIIIKHKTI